jgi:hypothetical protein
MPNQDAGKTIYKLQFNPVVNSDLQNTVRAHLLTRLDVLLDGRAHAIDGAGVVAYEARMKGNTIRVSAARWIVEAGGRPSGAQPFDPAARAAGLKVAVSGSRQPNPEDESEIEKTIRTVVARQRSSAMIFGGARGTDTVALRAARAGRGRAKTPRLVVIVPGTAKEQPSAARACIAQCADEVIELGLPLRAPSFLRRNAEMLKRADVLIAFWDGRPGGTSWTLNEARRRGIPSRIIALVGL